MNSVENIEERFTRIKNSEDSEVINDFLIELGNDPQEEYLLYLDYFMKNCTPLMVNNIKINLIYVLGQIGKYNQINDMYIDYLQKEYFKSDRWIRNEILKALGFIAINTKLPEQIIHNIEHAIVDEYLPIKINALSLMLHFEFLPTSVMNKLIGILSSPEPKLLDGLSRVFKKLKINDNQIFEILNRDKNYISMDKRTIRRLFIVYFKSVFDLENFRKLITNSNWNSEHKEIFLKELYTFEKILMKNL